mgnify:CR=1 FL=1
MGAFAVYALSSYYAEAYSLDFANDSDVDKMLNWVGSTVNEPNFLSKEDLKTYYNHPK